MSIPSSAATLLSPPAGFICRPLAITDYERYLPLLAQLTTVGEISREAWTARFRSLDPTAYFIYVIEETSTKELVSAASLIVEQKFIHQCGSVGHIEDVVTDQRYRGRRLGQYVVRCLCDLARGKGCYKVILDCKDSIQPFYQSCGFERGGSEMTLYFHH
ncbi:putative glucosamine 6-phosphate N-acetyltransferase [Paratrimastix pyriformis]|uniref:Glucosamine 6-phosphate N-acetyltransferase n=1 Tax=Paratrimastix pyriformis TaxID=342808 RepID=A0ABQ8UQG8_9EUKA|nr:putative glucosamine 6-phosphate N-acetyltransferase [Paratrimastix pyriformis]